MKKIFPSNKSTEFSPDLREWVPTSMDNLLRELDHISRACEQEDHLVLFRGQSNSEWPLDSTFVRDSIKHLFGINTYSDLPVSIRHQVSFHRVIASLLLMKFGTIWKPSKESFEKEKSSDIDPWYELLKNIQQYPENYYSTDFVKGTFFIDWTMYKEIALYFSVFEGRGAKREVSATTGAIWAYDSSSTGNVLQNNKRANCKTPRTNKLIKECHFIISALKCCQSVFKVNYNKIRWREGVDGQCDCAEGKARPLRALVVTPIELC